jgi:hypothetical protein
MEQNILTMDRHSPFLVKSYSPSHLNLVIVKDSGVRVPGVITLKARGLNVLVQPAAERAKTVCKGLDPES